MSESETSPQQSTASAKNSPTPHEISHRRKIGAFYTPLNVAKILCEWAIRTGDDLVFEPCFGGCTFLEAIYSRLTDLQCSVPDSQMYGCDLDPLAFSFLETRTVSSTHGANFKLGDFLAMDERTFPHKFDVMIGNPPYIRHSKFGKDQKVAVKAWSEKYNISLNGRSSLWAYFILHAMSFLREDGRMAWVLPSTFLTSAYAAQVRAIVSKNFKSVTAITLTQRLFLIEGTEEATVILIADGYAENQEETPIFSHCVDTVDELNTLISTEQPDSKIDEHTFREHGSGMLPFDTIKLYNDFDSENVTTLKNWANIQIGLVAGNVPFFIKSKKAWTSLRISESDLQYITPKPKWLRGISLTKQDSSYHIEKDIPCLALASKTVPDNSAISAYLKTYSKDDIEKNATFRKRAVWHYFFDTKIPDAFLTFMTHLGPRIVINDAAANCTNSLYRVYFNEGLPKETKLLIALAIKTTFSQFSAELLGQGRGSGALKLEPSQSSALRIFLPKDKTTEQIEVVFDTVDRLLRAEKFDEARTMADKFIFGDSEEARKFLSALESGLRAGRARRMRVEGV